MAEADGLISDAPSMAAEGSAVLMNMVMLRWPGFLGTECSADTKFQGENTR